MEASELRIGNYFMSNIIQQVNIEHLEFLLNDKLDHSVMQLIPLTEEWLVKFGGEPLYDVKRSKELNDKYAAQIESGQPLQFEYQEKAYAYRLNGELIVLNYTAFGVPLGPVIKIGDRIISLKYVHQLQNLYFALRGEELNP